MYCIMYKSILLTERMFLWVLAGLFCFSTLSAQTTDGGANITISGVVRDAGGETLPGATVIVRGTATGTITDIDGNFSLTVPERGTLVVSFVGFITQELAIDSSVRIIDVTLEDGSTAFDEVVVIGYGSQTRKELTGAITSLKPDDFNRGSFSNPMGLVQGRVAGLTVLKNGGDDPAQNSYRVQLRGTGSLRGAAEPLYVIDGVPGGNINTVAPGDIESIDVLKDGSAAAIYGTRANAGVILITTKRGRTAAGSAESAVEYNGSTNIAIMAKRPRMLTAAEYRRLMANDGMRGVDYGASTDWIEAITRNPISHQHSLSMAGGSEKFNYRASMNYRNIEGLAIKSSYEEINGRFAANQTALNSRLEIAYDLAYTANSKAWANHDNFLQALRNNPTKPIYSDDDARYGGYYETDGFYTHNPVADINLTDNDQRDKIMQASVRATLNLLPGLKFSTFVSMKDYGQWNGFYQASTLKSVYGKGGVARQSQRNDRSELIENTVQYIAGFGKNELQILAGQAYQYNVYQYFNSRNSNFSIDNLSYNNLSNGTGILTDVGLSDNNRPGISSSKYSDRLASFFARALYNYDRKYYLNASIRLEGSSKFGRKAHEQLWRWGIFPAISGSWVIDREDFMRNVNFVDELKLRIGYGVTGNMPADSYLYAVRLEQGDSQISVDGNWIIPFNIASNLNERLRWEKKQEYNVGVDFAVFNHKIHGAVDGYFRNTTDLLYEYNVPSPPYSVPRMWDNYGRIHNYGIEFSLNYQPINAQDLVLDFGFVAAVNRNKVARISTGYSKDAENQPFMNTGYISSGDGETGSYTMRLEEGKPVGNFYGWRYYGINAAGEWVFRTPTGGVTTSPQESDREILGNAQPDLTFGFNAAVRYKRFDAFLNFRGQTGGLIFNETRYFFENTRGSENVLLSAFEGEPSLLTVWAASGNTNASIRRFSDFYLERATYLKLSDLTIGYTPVLSENFTNYFSFVRVYFTAQNIFTLTGYKGIDPEIAPRDGDGLQPGFDSRSFYPRQRTFNLGVTLKF